MARNMVDIRGVAIDANNVLMLEKIERKNKKIRDLAEIEYGLKIIFKSRAFKVIWFEGSRYSRDSAYDSLFNKLK
jgi:hypothetical protein